MLTLSAERAALLVIDFQARLMPVIDDAAVALANARRLRDAAALFEVPVLYTEQNPKGLGPTVPEVAPGNATPVLEKATFDATRAAGFSGLLPPRDDIVVTGCEAHVCVLQTVLGLIDQGKRVFVVADAIGSRKPENKAAALARMARHGAEIVTTEMVVFEWLGSAEHPRFREAVALIK